MQIAPHGHLQLHFRPLATEAQWWLARLLCPKVARLSRSSNLSRFVKHEQASEQANDLRLSKRAARPPVRAIPLAYD